MLFVGLLSFGIVSTESIAAPDQNKIQNSSHMKTKNADVEFTVDSNTGTLQIEVENIGTAPVELQTYRGLLVCRILVKAADGRLCPHTELGVSVIRNAMGSSKVIRVPVAKRDKFTIPLARYFALTDGDWTIDCRLPMFPRDEYPQVKDLKFHFSSKNQNAK